MKREILAVSLLLTLALALTASMPLALAATEGSSSGTATVGNAAPSVSNPGLFDSTDSTNLNNTNLDVWVEYHVNCTVSDSNQLIDLMNVTFIIWETTYATESSADSNVNHYTFAWINSTDSWDEIGPDGSGDSHLVAASCSDPADLTATSGTWKLAFKLHKTANYTASKTWTVKIIAYDSAGNTGSVQTLWFGVNFYLELTVDDSSHGWSSLSPGDTDVLIDTPADGDIDVTVTANAPFTLQAKGSGNLADGSGNEIPLSNVKIHKDTLASATSLSTTYADIGGLTNLPAGESQTYSFKLWISVPSGQPSGTYTYTLYVQGIQA